MPNHHRLVWGSNWMHFCEGRVEAAHINSRGAGGGDRGNAIPLCRLGHQAQHTQGIKSWAQFWRLDLKKLAAEYAARYARETEF